MANPDMQRAFLASGGAKTPKKLPHARKVPDKKPRKQLRSRSPKQAKLEATWARIKRQKLDAQVGAVGYTFCEVCKAKTTALDLDHVEPRGRGGAYTEVNARLTCIKCHREKHG